MALTNAGMRAFRAAATLADVVPAVRIRIRDGEHHVCTVARTRPEPDDLGYRLSPCAFRLAVGRAHRMHRDGTRLCFLDVPPEREPAIDVGLPMGDAVLPGQIYRVVATDSRCLFLFMTELDVKASERAVSDALATAKRCDVGARGNSAQAHARRVGFHGDDLTELTVVHTMCAAADADTAALVMGRLLEVCVAAEAIAELGATVASRQNDVRP